MQLEPYAGWQGVAQCPVHRLRVSAGRRVRDDNDPVTWLYPSAISELPWHLCRLFLVGRVPVFPAPQDPRYFRMLIILEPLLQTIAQTTEGGDIPLPARRCRAL